MNIDKQTFNTLDVLYDDKKWGKRIDPDEWNANFKVLEQGHNELAEKLNQQVADIDTAIQAATSNGGQNISVQYGEGTETLQNALNNVVSDINNRYTKNEVDATVGSNTNSLLSNAEYNESTGVFTFTRKDGSKVVIDTVIEKVPASMALKDEPDGSVSLVITNQDGSTTKTNVTSLIEDTVINSSSTINATSVTDAVKKVTTYTLVIKPNSIGLSHVDTELTAKFDETQTAKTLAVQAKDNAVAAQNAAVAAQKSAENYASNSSSSASASATSADESADSALEAKGYAEQAASSKDSAILSASVASAKATAAATSESNAKTSETNAGTSETNALNSANDAKNYAEQANTYATNASNSANQASTYATNASGSADSASAKADEASDSAASALNYKTAAEVINAQVRAAKTAAEKARDEAQAAATSASESKASVEQTATSVASLVESAAQSASNASESATAAQQSNESAALSASNALASKNAASESATAALASKNAAAESASAAAISETNAAGSATAALNAQTAAEKARDEAESIAGGDYASVSYVDGKVAGLASETYVNNKVTGLATEEYVQLNGGKINSISVDGAAQTIDANKNVNIVLSGKVDKISGKQLSTEDYTTAEKNKLSGIAAGANNYTHPSTHAASMITQDSTHRFVTDGEKTKWNTNEVFIATYGTTTNSEIEAAWQSGKSVFCKRNGYLYMLTYSSDNGTMHIFSSVDTTSVVVVACSSNTWSLDYSDLPPKIGDTDIGKVLTVDSHGSFYFKDIKPTITTMVILASNWDSALKTYSFETDYPSASYDIEVALDSTAALEQAEAFNGAQIVGSATSNIIKAYGIVPTVNIPVVLKVVRK